MQNATQVDRVGVKHGRSSLADYAPTYGAAAALVLLLIVNAVFTPNFVDVNNLRNILLQVAPTVLVAIGMTMVIATGGIDLSVGSVMAIASALAAVTLGSGIVVGVLFALLALLGIGAADFFALLASRSIEAADFFALLAYLGVGVAILFALLASIGVGTLNGTLISAFRIQPIIVTLALLITGRGVAQVISNGGQLIPFSNPTFEYLGRGYVGPIPVQVLLMFIVVAAAIFVMRATSFGRYVAAVGGNEAAARLSGVKVHQTKIAVYAISGLLAGLAGLIETARLGASDASKVGLNIELDAIAATVVGGTPLTGGRVTIVGTLIGALIMQIITTSFNMNGIKFSWSLVIKAAIILVAVYIQRPKLA